MNEFSENFTVVLDANVLFGSKPRDLILSLAAEGLFCPRWSDLILKEIQDNLEKKYPDININHLYSEMENSFPEAKVSGHGIFLEKCRLGLKDADDNHVLATALMARASMIVTNNMKHFPNEYLEKFDLESKSADEFIADIILLYKPKSENAVKKILKRRNINIKKFIQDTKEAKLMSTVAVLERLKIDI